MIRWIVESSIRLRFLVIILAVILLVFGFVQLRQMPVAVYPEIDPPYVEVQTEALGLSAEEVEALVTVPMEADLLNGVAWLDRIYSRSVAGLSSILLIFEPGTDPIRARQMVQERLTQAHALPNVSTPPVMMQPLSSTNRAMMVGLSSDELSLIDMGVLARWNIKPRLLGVPGVANVAIWGQRERQLQVQVDPAELNANGVTLDQIIETAGEALWVSPLSYLEASAPGTAGWIDTPNQRLSVRHLLPITTPDDLARVALVEHEGLILGDVASVVEDHQPMIGDAALTEGPGLILVVEKFPGANMLEVTRGVEKALEDLQPGLQGMQIDTTLFRPANYIETAVGNLTTLAIIGLVLIALILLAFYFQWRSALISLIAIPLSLVGAVTVLYLTDATFNVVLLIGIVVALAIVVDDAIVDVENVSRRLRERTDQGDAMSVIVNAIIETRSPLGFALLIILLAALPIMFLPGLSGAFFQPLVVSYVLAIIVSLIVALIVSPALSYSLLPAASKRVSPIAQWLETAYGGLLKATVRAGVPALIVALVLIVIGAVAIPFLNVSLLPELKQSDLLIELEAAPGTSRPEMNRITAKASEELRTIPGVRNVSFHVGRAITGDAVVGINSGEIWVSLDESADYPAALASINNVIGGFPGLAHDVQTYQPEQITATFIGSDSEMVVRIYGHELDTLSAKALEVEQVVAGIDGVAEARAELYAERPQVEIEVDLDRAEAFGLKPGDVRRQATTLLSGILVGNLFEEQKVFDVVVWAKPELRGSLTDIRELMLDTPTGEQVALGEVADVRIVPTATVIERDAVSRYLDVDVSVAGRSVDAVKADIEAQIQQVDIPFEYHMEVLSNFQAVQTNQTRLIAIAIAAVLGIYLLLQAAFSSWRLAFLILLVLPMALVGGVLAALIGGSIMSIGATFGLFAIFALAVRNGLIMIHHFQNLARAAGNTVGPDLVVRGAQERLTPVLMSALATGLALTPMLLAGNIPGNEILRPMAAVILGGLITSTLLTLFIVPAVYLRWPSTLPVAASTEAGPQPTPEAA